MSDRSLTLLALHLDDAAIQIGPKRIDRSTPDAGDTAPDDTGGEEPTERGGARPVATLVSVIVVILAIVAILRRVGGPAESDGIDLEDAASED
jgi:hypothetical protein